MSVSAVAPTPFPVDPDRLVLATPQNKDSARTEGKDSDGKPLSMFAEGGDSPSFWDLLDVINPLQHIPVVNTFYRELTGDQIGVGARLAGGTLFGGPIGLVASAVDCMIEEGSGKNTGEHMLALFRDDQPDGGVPATALASAPPEPAAAPAPKAAPAELAQAPVISLPQNAPSTMGQAMAFSAEGLVPQKAVVAPAPVTPAPTAAVTQAPLAPVQLASAGGPQLEPPARMRPAPSRTNTAMGTKPAPPLSVPVSGNSNRSNVPITGRDPNAVRSAGSAVSVQKAMAEQGLTGANHPMLPPTDASGQNAAAPDWFATAWSQALDKYQKGANLGQTKPSAAETLTQ